MIVLGLDPSTKFGVAVVSESGGIIHHTEEIEYKKESGLQRASSIVGRVLEIKEEYKPDLIVIEEMFVGHSSSAIPIIGLGTILRYFLWQEDVTPLEVHPSTLKKWVAGSGKATKEQMMMHVLKNWGFESPTNNIADAVGLAMFGLCCVTGGFTAARRKICFDVLKEQPAVYARLTANNFAIKCKCLTNS